VHVHPQGGEKFFFWAKFTGECCKCTPDRECTPRQSKSPIFKEIGEM